VIHPGHGAGAFARITSLLDALAPQPEYRSIFDRAIGMVRASSESAGIFLPIDLPVAVGGLLGRSEEDLETAAAASTCLWAGADLMDDAADRQLSEAWAGVSDRMLALVSTNLLATFPHLLVSDLEGRDASISAAYSRAVSETLFSMSEGQARDFDSARVVCNQEQYLALGRRKSGAEFGLFAATPALLAGLRDEVVEKWLGFGLAFGTMVQVFHDTVSAIAEGPRNDLFEGKRSIPVLHALANTSGEDHLRLVADLDLARHGDHAAVPRAIEAMVQAGSIRFSFEQVELLRYRASAALPVKLADLDREHSMRRLLSACSIL
jgi:geranylgeranyl pyrophosphate synthase